MLLFDGALGILALGVWIFCIIDVITTPDDQVRNLPKLVWLLLVLLLADVGSIVWLIAGRPWPGAATSLNGARRDPHSPARPTSPDDDEEFLAGLRARAEEQRRRAREAADRQAQQDEPPTPSGS